MKSKISLEIQEIEKGNYHLFVTLKIGGRKARLLLDTGASKTVFDQHKVLKFVSESAFKELEGMSVGLGVSELKTSVVRLPKAKAGELKFESLEVAVLPLDHVNESYRKMKLKEIDGVLGSDFLMKHKAVICYAKMHLKLTQ